MSQYNSQVLRREFVGTLAGAAWLARRGPAQTPPRPFRIDIHHHHSSPEYRASVADPAAQQFPPWSPAQSIDVMDRGGVEKSILSVSLPGVWFGNVQQARRLARMMNDYGAQMARDFPGRFGLFAALPLPDAEGSLREIEYAYGTLKAAGIGLLTSYDGKYLGDAAFAPVWEELNRRRAVVYTHPLTPACCGALDYSLGPGAIEWATDTTRTIASLLFTGAAARYPDIRWIFSHGGGTFPFLLSRFQREAQTQKGVDQRLPRGLMYELRRFYYDTAQANTRGALSALLEMVPASQVLYGSDYPFRTFEEVTGGLAAYGFSPGDLRAIERENALVLLS
jgi:predicted TIM-barrel fold metal-dependent hydrolase